MVSSTPWPHFTTGKDPVPIVQEAGWAPAPDCTGRKSRPHRDSILYRPARSSVGIPTELPCPLICHPIVPKLRICEAFLQFPIRLHVIPHSTQEIYFLLPVTYGGPGSSVGIVTELRAGRSGIESPWGRDFPPFQTGPGAHPCLL